jgi:hypothetical protein
MTETTYKMITEQGIEAAQRAYSRVIHKQAFSNDIKLTGLNTKAMKAALTAYEDSKWDLPENAPVGERRLIEASYIDDDEKYYFIATKEDTGDWQHDNGYYVSQDAQYVTRQQPLPTVNKNDTK